MRLSRLLLGIDPAEATFARRGFQAADPAVRARLEEVGFAFLRGYHAALEAERPSTLAPVLDAETAEHRGFAYEGAGMALALLDLLLPWGGGRLARFAAGPGEAHRYLVYVGAGWAMARLRRPMAAPPRGTDPLLGWLVADGYGFHEGYFHPGRTVERREVPRRLGGYARRAFDHGLGRSLWFVLGADPERVARAVASFGEARAGDLWSGVGLACAYAGSPDPATAWALAEVAGRRWRPELAQGAAFAAKARERAGNPVPYTDAACRALCGTCAAEAAAATDRALEGLAGSPGVPAYERWRIRIRTHLFPAYA